MQNWEREFATSHPATEHNELSEVQTNAAPLATLPQNSLSDWGRQPPRYLVCRWNFAVRTNAGPWSRKVIPENRFENFRGVGYGWRAESLPPDGRQTAARGFPKPTWDEYPIVRGGRAA